MQIYRPRPDDTSARQRYPRLTQTRQERAENANGTAHLSDQIIIADAIELRRLHRESPVLEFHFYAERRQDLSHESHIAQIGHTPNDAFFFRQQRRRHDRQHRVLGSANGHVSVQWSTAFD